MGPQQTSLDEKRILLVEDDDRIIDFMQRGLEAEGFQVDVASAKAPALHLTTSHRYDVIILDIFLGDDDGIELCRVLRERSIDTPVLVMTAKDSEETRRASEEAGADAYLPKPFAFEDLLAMINGLEGAGTSSDSLKESQTR